MNRNKKTFICMALITMFVFLAGCSSLNPVSATIGNDITQEVTIEKDNAESLDVTIDFSVGNLMVSGGAQSSDWMTGELLYNNKDFEAKAEYRQMKNRGEIILKQKNSGKWNSIVSDTKNQWDLELNNSVPTDLSIKAGVAESKLDLKGLHLTTLSVDAGVGSMEVDLSGDWLSSFKGEIKTGIGETTILLPKDVGVEITAKTGIGAVNFDGFISKGNNVYVNEAYDTADVVITITANTGIGETKFALK